MAESDQDVPFVPDEEEQLDVDKERQQIRDWMSEAEGRALKFLVAGRGGIGKSALINNLLGLDRDSEYAAKEAEKGYVITATTRSVSAHESVQLRRNGINVVAFDTPGFQDPNVEDSDIIAQILQRTGGHVDVFLYCASLRQRFSKEDHTVCALLTKCFTKSIWKKAIFVLTRANEVSTLEYDENIGKEELQKAVKAAGVPEDIVAAIPVCTAGSKEGTWQDRIYTEMIRRAEPNIVPALLKFSWGQTALTILSGGGFLTGPASTGIVSATGTVGAGAAIGGAGGGVVGAVIGAAVGATVGAAVGAGFIKNTWSDETKTIVQAQYKAWKKKKGWWCTLI